MDHRQRLYRKAIEDASLYRLAGYSFDTFSSFKLLSLRKTKKVNMEKIHNATNLSHCGPHIAHEVIPQTMPKAKNTINLPANTVSAILIIEVASMNIPL
jgi:hypothetical protein